MWRIVLSTNKFLRMLSSYRISWRHPLNDVSSNGYKFYDTPRPWSNLIVYSAGSPEGDKRSEIRSRIMSANLSRMSLFRYSVDFQKAMAYLKAIHNIKFLITYFSVNLRLFFTREEIHLYPPPKLIIVIRCFIDKNKGHFFIRALLGALLRETLLRKIMVFSFEVNCRNRKRCLK